MKPRIRREYSHIGNYYWQLYIPDIGYSGGWYTWDIAMLALYGYYKFGFTTGARVNTFVNRILDERREQIDSVFGFRFPRDAPK